MRLAIIIQRIVDNVVIAEAREDYEAGEGEAVIEIAEEQPVAIGWGWDGTRFVEPPSA